MTIIFNYLPTIILIVFLFYMARLWMKEDLRGQGWDSPLLKQKLKKSAKAFVVFLIVLFGVMAATPSYLPKGQVNRLPVTKESIPTDERPMMTSRIRLPAQTDAEREARNKELFDAVNQATSKPAAAPAEPVE